MNITTITTADALNRFAPTWDALLERAEAVTPFVTPLWTRCWWEAFGAGNALRVLTVYDGDQCVAVVPMMQTGARMYGVPVCMLELIGNLHTPRFDFIVARDRPDVYGAIWQHLQQVRWDVLKLPELVAESATMRSLATL